jgi:hypothetical protein
LVYQKVVRAMEVLHRFIGALDLSSGSADSEER